MNAKIIATNERLFYNENI